MCENLNKRPYLIENHFKGEMGRNMAIVIDGIIGAGKSTVGTFLSETLGIPLYEELKEDGSISRAQRMLDLFYEEPCRWSAITQVMFLSDRFEDLKKIEKRGERAILDRSIYGDEIFARTLHGRGQMTSDEFDIYLSVLNHMLEHIKPPELLIYIDVSVDTALRRIQKRSRSTEGDTIPRDYLEDLRAHYERWFDAYDISPKIKLDLNISMLDENGKITKEARDKVLSAISPFL